MYNRKIGREVRQRLAKPSSRVTGRAFESLIFRMDFLDHNHDDEENVPAYDPITRQHLWILLAAFRVDPTTVHPSNAQLLTNEDLLNTAGPGCYYCEVEWRDQAMALAPCTGPD